MTGAGSHPPHVSGRLDAALERTPATLLLLAAMSAFQVGGALGVWLFPAFGAVGGASIRTFLSGAFLVAATRPRVRGLSREAVRIVLGLGVLLGLTNAAYYASIQRIPIGITVTVAFCGPLTVALVKSRHRRDLLWIVMAAAGVALLGGLPGGAALDPLGLFFAAVDGACWAIYAIAAQRVGTVMPPSQCLTLSLLVAGVILSPAILLSFDGGAVDAGVWAAAIGAGVFTGLPYLLEFAALQRMRVGLYGILVSLEPALATVAGVIILGQHPSAVELVAVALVVAASIGATLSAGVAVAADVGDV